MAIYDRLAQYSRIVMQFLQELLPAYHGLYTGENINTANNIHWELNTYTNATIIIISVGMGMRSHQFSS